VLALTISTAPGAPFILTDVDYFIQLLTAAMSISLEHGYPMTVAGPRNENWSTLPIDGAIVVDPVLEDAALADLKRRHIPHVTTGRDPSGDDLSYWVDNDHVAATRIILDHLAHAGARRVALLCGPAIHSYTIDALRSYEDWCSHAGQPVVVAFAKDGVSDSAGYAAAVELLDKPDPPDAIYATLDRFALSAKLVAETRGLHVPDDLLLAGLSDSAASRAAKLTVLHLNPEAIGSQAAELLIRQVEGQQGGQTRVVVPAEVIVRASTSRAGRQS
jgi:DNA-binding LacI/PurR family transcriptional regulator